MLSQTNHDSSKNCCARNAARQRRDRFLLSVAAGALLSLGALTTLQAASESQARLPVGSPTHGAASRLLAGLDGGNLAANALPYAALVNLPQARVEAPLAGAGMDEPQRLSGTTGEAIENVIELWVKAWQSKDVNAYLAAYGEGFLPANGIAREDWATLRRQRIAEKREIRLELRAIEIQQEAADRVRVSFIQDYRADQYTELGTAKSIVLALERDGWRIVAEELVR